MGVFCYCVSVCENVCSPNYVFGLNLHCCESILWFGMHVCVCGGGYTGNLLVPLCFWFQTEKIGAERQFLTLRNFMYICFFSSHGCCLFRSHWFPSRFRSFSRLPLFSHLSVTHIAFRHLLPSCLWSCSSPQHPDVSGNDSGL